MSNRTKRPKPTIRGLKKRVKDLEAENRDLEARRRNTADRLSVTSAKLDETTRLLEVATRERNHFQGRLDKLVALNEYAGNGRRVEFRVGFDEKELGRMIDDGRLLSEVRTQVAGHAVDQAIRFFKGNGWVSNSPPDSVWGFEISKRNTPWREAASVVRQEGA